MTVQRALLAVVTAATLLAGCTSVAPPYRGRDFGQIGRAHV